MCDAFHILNNKSRTANVNEIFVCFYKNFPTYYDDDAVAFKEDGAHSYPIVY